MTFKTNVLWRCYSRMAHVFCAQFYFVFTYYTLAMTEYKCSLLPLSSCLLNVFSSKEMNPCLLVCYVRLCSVFLALGVSFIFYIASEHLKLNFLDTSYKYCMGTRLIKQVLIFIKWKMSSFFLRNGKHSQTDKGWIVHCKNRTRGFWWWPQICWVQCLQCGEWHRLLQT